MVLWEGNCRPGFFLGRLFFLLCIFIYDYVFFRRGSKTIKKVNVDCFFNAFIYHFVMIAVDQFDMPFKKIGVFTGKGYADIKHFCG